MTETEQLATLAGKMLEDRVPKNGEQLIAQQQAFIHFQEMMFWFNAFDTMQSMQKTPVIHAG